MKKAVILLLALALTALITGCSTCENTVELSLDGQKWEQLCAGENRNVAQNTIFLKNINPEARFSFGAFGGSSMENIDGIIKISGSGNVSFTIGTKSTTIQFESGP